MPRGSTRCKSEAAILVVAIACACPRLVLADLAERGSSRGEINLRLGVSLASSDLLWPADDRPNSHGTVGGVVGLEVGISDQWELSIAGRGLGSWFDYTSSVDLSGNTKEFEPGISLGLDRTVWRGDGTRVTVGASFEYREARTWVHNLVFRIPYELTGPRNVMRGIQIRGSLYGPSSWRIVPFVELAEFAYTAHAYDPSVHAKYNWLGRSTSATIGCRVALRRPHQAR